MRQCRLTLPHVGKLQFSAVGNVHRDFKAKAQVSKFWFRPFHINLHYPRG
jgi:hypothetical protein